MRRLFLFKMSTLEKILQNNNTVAEKLNALKQELEITKRDLIQQKKEQYFKENANLSKHVEKLKSELIYLEKQNGKKQIPIPDDKTIDDPVPIQQKSPLVPVANSPNVPVPSENEQSKQSSQKQEKEKKPKKEKQSPTTKVTASTTDGGNNKSDDANSAIHVGQLDMRIGKIIEISQHPDADSLYLEKIDCGDTSPRTVISGLVKFVPIEQMKDRLVVVLCNLKPAKMRGIISEAMVMCASTPEKVEVLSPPNDSLPGDLVHCETYERNPPSQLNPKKKIFETVAVDLKTNSELIACYKDQPLYVPGKGNIMAQTLKNVNIK